MATANSARLLSRVRLSETPRPAAPQAPLSTGLPRRGHGWVTVYSSASRVNLLSLNNCSSASGESSVLTAEQCPLGAETGAGLQAGRKSGPCGLGRPLACSPELCERGQGSGPRWWLDSEHCGRWAVRERAVPFGGCPACGQTAGQRTGLCRPHTHTDTHARATGTVTPACSDLVQAPMPLTGTEHTFLVC